MLLTVEFNNEQEKEEIINKNLDKYLIEVKYLLDGNFLVFSNKPTLENKISILEAENEVLKEELALTQDAVNEVLFMMLNLKWE